MRVRSAINLKELAFHLDLLPKVVDGTGVLMANGQFRIMPVHWHPIIKEAIHEAEVLFGARVLYVMANTIEPSRRTVMHVDPLPQGRKLERWHLPVRTNASAWFEADGKRGHMEQGWWHGPVKYWEPHAVGNDGGHDRTHLIVDLDLDYHLISERS